MRLSCGMKTEERLRQPGLMLKNPAWAVQAILLCSQPAGIQGFNREANTGG